ncbi:unnamed protein product, partial [marine sediment metagenome]
RFSKALVIVSYYDDPRLELLYEGFKKIELAANYASLRNATGGKKKKPRKRQVEVLLVNNQIEKELF